MTPSETPSERRAGSNELARRSGAPAAGSDAARRSGAAASSSPARRDTPSPAARPEPREKPAPPARPALHDKAAAPVMVKMPPPASVRLAQISWILSLVVGGIAIGYMFVIRQPILPDIEALIRDVDPERLDETVTAAADILFWSVFGALVAVMLVQITSLVSFGNRRPRARWWMLGILLFQGVAFLAARQLIAVGDRGIPLERLLLIQLGLSLLGLLFSLLPGALRWTARKHDIRRGDPDAVGSSEF